MTSRTKIILAAFLVLAVIAWWQLTPTDRRESGDKTASPKASALAASASSQALPSAVASAPDAASRAIAGTRLIGAKWGGGLGELGRERPQEGNAEGPMSFAPAGDGLVVVDQVNGRIARYDGKGRFERAQDIAKTVQDVAIAKDGSAALLDRLGEKKITLLDPRGTKVGELPLSKVGEPGLVTGVFVDGKNVYVEKEHGALVLLGTTDGRPPDEGKELTGRPSKDGALLLTAGLSSAKEGKAYLNALDRKTSELRFARAIQFPRPASAIVLLDSDAKGTLYLGVAGGADPAAHVACLDSGDGHVIGRIVLPLSTTAEESFRDLAVNDAGQIIFALRTEDGVEYRTATCP